MEKQSGGGKKRRGRGRGREQVPTGQEAALTPPVVEIAELSLEEKLSTCPKKPAEAEKQENVPEEESFEKKLMLRDKKHGTGTRGRPILLYANFYPVELDKNLIVHHYDVSVSRKIAKATEKKGKPTSSTTSKQDSVQVSRLPRFLAATLLDQLFKDNGSIFVDRYGLAFDGQKNLFSRHKLTGIDEEGREFGVKILNIEKNIDEEFILKIKWAANIKVDIRQVFDRDLMARKSLATLVLDVILKQSYFFDLKNYIPQQRRIFYYPEPIDNFPLGSGVYRFPGFWQSIRPVSGWKIMLNFDKANTSFVKGGNVLDLLAEVGFNKNYWYQPIDRRTMSEIKKKLEKLVKGLKITQRQRRTPRVSKCIGVSLESAEQIMFDDSERGRISVADYFRQQHKLREFVSRIEFPHLPCLHVGSPNKKNFVPLEFCEVKAGQRYPKKLDAGQTSQMLNYASEPADRRKRSIQEDVEYLKLDKEKYLKSFGINVTQEMIKFNGRVLDPPMIQFSGANDLPRLGSWNMRGRRVISACCIRKFGILCTGPQQKYRKDEIDNFCKQLYTTATGMGLKIESREPAWCGFEMAADQMRARLREAKGKVGPSLDLVFVILDGQNTDFYPCVKQAGDVVEGVNTQCIQLKNVRAARADTIANVCLKINGKLGGVNSHLTDNSKKSVSYFLKEPILFLGADVNHPAPGDGRNDDDDPVSCAAIVGNIDAHPSVYCARIFLQAQIETRTNNGLQVTRRPQEFISDMKDGVKMAIEHFVERNGVLPRRIIMYRDGVGETMFLLVLNRELTAIREACTESADRFPQYVKKGGYTKGYEPPITFIVVQKRHHTRLFCANEKEAVGRGNNVPPGTTVDVAIVHPEEFDFYLCSHLGIQGTSKPAHYHVLWDDSNFTADDLQTLTYHLCHTYCRATRSVSIPPPCYYADLVAYRARQYLSSRLTDASTVSSGHGVQPSIAELQRWVNVQDNIVKKGMYFV